MSHVLCPQCKTPLALVLSLGDIEPPPEPINVTREEAYRIAYCAGIAQAFGAPFAWPGGMAAQGTLNQAVLAHARNAEQKAFRGDQLLHWIEDAAHDFGTWLKENTEQARFYGAGHPQHFGKWLNEDAQRQLQEKHP